ncbi:hypothetical protein HCJ58_00035 [Listeria sp. FSL L7-1509]|uniref:Uncharacterized protein n=1 Tax=Listeria immobilis TaxID=2713502 RepID=A0ABR6SU39_9LIST|nr:hypothetical protein [Listeria immobilis]MBC1484160.1 hypothetical protein [Listeria immobilis]MBC1505377.1 hypothetical protein [Listeria immobilis]MBC1509191.1 hypothetical protein [Listeria immobilis]MBC6313612.1 hypothetical protein [Listeria immobilis]
MEFWNSFFGIMASALSIISILVGVFLSRKNSKRIKVAEEDIQNIKIDNSKKATSGDGGMSSVGDGNKIINKSGL